MSNAIPAADVKLKRSYNPAADADGTRYLVDRLWPRGIGIERGAVARRLPNTATTSFALRRDRFPELERLGGKREPHLSWCGQLCGAERTPAFFTSWTARSFDDRLSGRRICGFLHRL